MAIRQPDHKLFSAVYIERDFGGGRVRKTVVDHETGEIVCEAWSGNAGGAFEAGYNAALGTLMVGREINANGNEHITVSEYSTNGLPRVILRGWRNPQRIIRRAKPKHTGGKPSYIKLLTGGMTELASKAKDADLGALVRLAQNVDWETGALIDTRTKKPLDFAGLMRATGYNRQTLSSRLKSLREIDALTVDDQDRYIISRQLLQKG